jgi:hypothetical protein
MASVYGAVTTAAGNAGGSEPAVRTPDGAVLVRQLYHGEEAGDSNIVPAPPVTNKDAVNTRICSLDGCRGKRKSGDHLCAPHRVADDNRKLKRKALIGGDATGH